jgi:hypothetical protein
MRGADVPAVDDEKVSLLPTPLVDRGKIILRPADCQQPIDPKEKIKETIQAI